VTDPAVTDRIRVMVVDDHPVWRDGIRGDLEGSGVATVVAEASDGGEAIELALEHMPDVVLMDLRSRPSPAWTPPAASSRSHPT